MGTHIILYILISNKIVLSPLGRLQDCKPFPIITTLSLYQGALHEQQRLGRLETQYLFFWPRKLPLLYWRSGNGNTEKTRHRRNRKTP